MTQIRTLLAAVLVFAGISTAIAQVPSFTLPPSTVVGRSATGTAGPAQAIPFSLLTAQICSTFTLTLKGCVPAPGSTTGRYLSDDIVTPWKAIPSQQIVAGSGVTVSGTCTGNALNCTVNSTATTQFTFQSRAIAAGQDLSALSAIRTLGYALPGDGGGAVFKKVSGSTAFIDSFISTFSIQGGSGCTNGTYGAPSGSVTTTAVIWNKSGNPSIAVGTATASGGTVTVVSIAGTPGNAYSVGDVLTTSGVTGCSPTITVTGVTTPLASFTDSVGNRWQYTPDTATYPNLLQFGCKGDWDGVDASATNNFNCAQAAANFAGYKSSTNFDSGGWWGGKVLVPSGSFMMCGSTYFVLPEGTVMEGASASGSSTLRLCDAFNPNIHGFTICDPVWGFACLGTMFKNLSFSASRSVAAGGNIFMIYSNNLQDFGGLREVYIYSGQRGGFWFEKGYGGSTFVGAEKVSVNQGSPNNVMVKIGNTTASGMNFGSTAISLKDLVLGGPTSSPFQLQGALQILGGSATVEGVHCENMNQWCVFVEVPNVGNNLQQYLHDISSQGCASGGTCNGIISLGSTNQLGNTVLGKVWGGSGYTHMIENGQPAGANYDLAITNFARFNPSFVQP